MKKIVLLVTGAGFLFVLGSALTVGVADWRNQRDPGARFLTEGPPAPAVGVVATAYHSLGATCRTRSWTLSHTPEQLRTWLGLPEFKRADQRLAGIRQHLEPEARPPFKDGKYSAAYARDSAEGHFLLVMEGGQRSCYVVVDQPLRGSLLGLFASSTASK